MGTIRTLVAAAFAAGVAVSAAVPATAQTQARSAGDQATPGRAVLICARDAASRRAFAREHGAQPVFITAREVQAMRPSDPAWTTPRCMTEQEHARLKEAATANARAS